MEKRINQKQFKPIYQKFNKLVTYTERVQFYLDNGLGYYKFYSYCEGPDEHVVPEATYVVDGDFNFKVEIPNLKDNSTISINPCNFDETMIFWKFFMDNFEKKFIVDSIEYLKSEFNYRLEKTPNKMQLIKTEKEVYEKKVSSFDSIQDTIKDSFLREIDLAIIVNEYYNLKIQKHEQPYQYFESKKILEKLECEDFRQLLIAKNYPIFISYLMGFDESLADNNTTLNNITNFTPFIKLKWKGTNNQLYSVIRQLKKAELLLNSNEDMATFLKYNVDKLNITALATILTELKRNKSVPKSKRINLDLNDPKEDNSIK